MNSQFRCVVAIVVATAAGVLVAARTAAASSPLLGEQRIAVLLSSFGGAPDTVSVTEPATTLIAKADSVAAWVSENSWDHSAGVDTARCTLDIDVYGWTIIPYASAPSADLSWNEVAALVSAVETGGLQAGDIENYDRFVFVFAQTVPFPQRGDPQPVTYSDSINVVPVFEDVEITRAYLYGADYGSGEGTTASVGDLTHELFHTWDLQHAQARNSMSAGPSADKLYRPYGNLTDVMGGASSPPPPRRRRP